MKLGSFIVALLLTGTISAISIAPVQVSQAESIFRMNR